MSVCHMASMSEHNWGKDITVTVTRHRHHDHDHDHDHHHDHDHDHHHHHHHHHDHDHDHHDHDHDHDHHQQPDHHHPDHDDHPQSGNSYGQWVSNGVTCFLHWAIDVISTMRNPWLVTLLLLVAEEDSCKVILSLGLLTRHIYADQTTVQGHLISLIAYTTYLCWPDHSARSSYLFDC